MRMKLADETEQQLALLRRIVESGHGIAEPAVELPGGDIARAIGRHLDAVGGARAAIVLKGVQVRGELRLSTLGIGHDGCIDCSLERCSLESPLVLEGASLRQLNIEDCSISEVRAASLHTTNSVRLNTVVDSRLDFRGCRIGGSFLIEGLSQFRAGPAASDSSGAGVDLSGARIDGDFGMVRRDRNHARNSRNADCAGGISLQNATIGGDVSFLATHIRLNSGGNYAIDATGAQIGHTLRVRDSLLGGSLRMEYCKVGTEVDLSRSHVFSPVPSQPWKPQLALDASVARVEGDFVIQECRFEGAIILRGAQVGTSLRCLNFHVAVRVTLEHDKSGERDYAFEARDLEVGGCVTLTFSKSVKEERDAWQKEHRYKLPAEKARDKLPEGVRLPYVSGGVCFDRASIAGDLILSGLCLNHESSESVDRGSDKSEPAPVVVMSARGVTIGGRLETVQLLNLLPATLDLTLARARVLGGNYANGWGFDDMMLRLDGFQYDAVDARPQAGETTAKEEIDWLARQAPRMRGEVPVNLHPYQQLARTLKSDGNMARAREVLIAGFNRELEFRPAPSEVLRRTGWLLGRRISWLFGFLFGYGYNPTRTFIALLGWWLFGVGLVYLGKSNDSFVVEAVALEAESTLGSRDPAGWAPLPNVFLPQYRLKPSDAEQPVICRNKIDPLVYGFDVMVPLIDLRQESLCSVQPAVAAWVKALYAVLGWIITSVGILTFAGVLNRDLR